MKQNLRQQQETTGNWRGGILRILGYPHGRALVTFSRCVALDIIDLLLVLSINIFVTLHGYRKRRTKDI